MLSSRTLRRLFSYCIFTLTLLATSAAHAAADPWQTTLKQEIPLLGHRNWIVIVDSAYPLQVSPGVETIETNATQPQVLAEVLHQLSLSQHVAPYVYMDAELPFVPERSAPGVTAYRSSIPSMLHTLPVHALPHLELIKTLNDAGATFHILVLKTSLTIPYSSIFLRLDCKYWDDGAERNLQAAMKKK